MLQVRQIFDDSGQRFGAEKIRFILAENGVRVGKPKIRGIMQELGLERIHNNAKKNYQKRQEYKKKNLSKNRPEGVFSHVTFLLFASGSKSEQNLKPSNCKG